MATNTLPQKVCDQPETEADDEIIWGAENIGKTINRSARQVFHLASKELIPVKRVGNRLCASKAKLLAIAD
jgi:hypothetical protein